MQDLPPGFPPNNGPFVLYQHVGQHVLWNHALLVQRLACLLAADKHDSQPRPISTESGSGLGQSFATQKEKPNTCIIFVRVTWDLSSELFSWVICYSVSCSCLILISFSFVFFKKNQRLNKNFIHENLFCDNDLLSPQQFHVVPCSTYVP